MSNTNTDTNNTQTNPPTNQVVSPPVNQTTNTPVIYQPQSIPGQPIPVQPEQSIPVQPAGQPIPVQPAGQPIPVQPGQPIPIQPAGQPIPVQPGQPVYMQVQNQPMYLPVPANPNVSQSMVYYQPQQSSVQYYAADPNVSVLSTTSNIIPPSTPVPLPAGEPPSYQQTLSPTNDVKNLAEQQVRNAVVICNSGTYVPKHSYNMYCPYCKKNVPSVVEFENNTLVWLLCIGLCFIFIIYRLFDYNIIWL